MSRLASCVRLPAVLLASALVLGCFVFEELDNAKALADNAGPRARAAAAAAKAPEAEPEDGASAASGPGLLDRVKEWWAKRSQPPPPERDPEDVTGLCQTGSRSWYTRKFDCLARGGSFEPAG